MPDAAPSPLDALRPLHAAIPALPAAALAMLAAGLLAGLLLGWLLWPALRRWRGVRRAALERLADTRSLPSRERLSAQAKLLRRVVLTLHGEAAARLRGADWLARLDAVFATTYFTAGDGRCFGEQLYRPGMDCDARATDRELSLLFRRLRQ